MVELDEYDETQLAILQTVIEVEVTEVKVETHSMVMVEEVETLDVQVDVDEMVETQYADADEMVEMLIDFITIIEINEVTDDIDI
jgi:mRNA-degrading endonuclease toxin of MazEF toxin-antitoxin module